ncbi:hypothetical protein ES703_69695 [subsurface metagenome]
MGADRTAALHVFDPELTDLFILATQGEPGFCPRMGETGRVEINLDGILLGPIHPTLIMLWLYLVPVDSFFSEITIHGVQVQPLFSGNEGKSFFQVHPELFERPRFARIAARRLDPATSGGRI